MNIVHRIREFALQEPGRRYATILRGGHEELLTYGELMRAALRAGSGLKREYGIRHGDVVLLIQDQSVELLCSFIGCMAIGAIPTIIAVPGDRIDPQFYAKRISHLLSITRSQLILISQSQRNWLSNLPDREATQHRVGLVEEILNAKEGEETKVIADGVASIAPENTALLQHSSGTTGHQKGVMLSHRSILEQSESLSLALRIDPRRDVVVSWLPLYHDMGLIGAFLLPLLSGVPVVMMSPFEWVRSPALLLRAISRHRGTLCFLPNFSYSFLADPARMPDFEISGIDLASMRAFINCSEPVRKESHERFLTRFARYGLKKEAMASSYALAENTFAATVGGIGERVREDRISAGELTETGKAVPIDVGHSRVFLSSGTPIPGTRIRILDEDHRPVAERRLGEIAIQSDYMLEGYYNRPELSESAFSDGWYLTGDMGYLADGHLFVIGRKRDVIIVGGKNIYPEDIEHAISDLAGIHPGRVVAFGVFDDKEGTEKIVVVAEVKEGADKGTLKRRVKNVVSWETGQSVGSVLLVEGKWLAKTSSGKISRESNRQKYLNTLGKMGGEEHGEPS